MRRWSPLLVAGVIAVAACGGADPPGDPAPPVTTGAAGGGGGVGGLVDQVDRARQVGADLEERNTSLEGQYP